MQDRRHRQRPAALQSAAARGRGVRHARRHVAAAGSSPAWSSAAARNISPTSVNPTHARERFREALDLIVKAWTTPGPFMWNSKHYFFRYVNPWPRPLQQPHPPIWIPGAGSLETIEFVAQRRYAYMGIPYFHIDVFRRVFGQFREACQKAGYTRRSRSRWAGACRFTWPRPTTRPARSSSRTCGTSSATCSRTSTWRRPATPRRDRPWPSFSNRSQFLAEQETWDDIEKGVFAIVGSPGDGAAEAGPVPEGAGRRRGADGLPDGRPAARTGAEEHGDAGPGGVAACSIC